MDDTRNLPKIGTGFGKVHASLREIPEGDEKSAGSGFSRKPEGFVSGMIQTKI